MHSSAYSTHRCHFIVPPWSWISFACERATGLSVCEHSQAYDISKRVDFHEVDRRVNTHFSLSIGSAHGITFIYHNPATFGHIITPQLFDYNADKVQNTFG